MNFNRKLAKSIAIGMFEAVLQTALALILFAVGALTVLKVVSYADSVGGAMGTLFSLILIVAAATGAMNGLVRYDGTKDSADV